MANLEPVVVEKTFVHLFFLVDIHHKLLQQFQVISLYLKPLHLLIVYILDNHHML
jgi:hypothetical protein